MYVRSLETICSLLGGGSHCPTTVAEAKLLRRGSYKAGYLSPTLTSRHLGKLHLVPSAWLPNPCAHSRPPPQPANPLVGDVDLSASLG